MPDVGWLTVIALGATTALPVLRVAAAVGELWPPGALDTRMSRCQTPHVPLRPRDSATSGRSRIAGFATLLSADMDAWLSGQAAFVVPIAFPLYRVGVGPHRPAGDPATHLGNA